MFLAGEPMKSVMKVTRIGIQKEHTSAGAGWGEGNELSPCGHVHGEVQGVIKIQI